MKCAHCKGEIEVHKGGWDQGHNGRPLVDGRVCDTCNYEEVIPLRMKQLQERTKRIRPLKKYGASYAIKLSPTDMEDFNLKEGDLFDISNLRKNG